MRRTERSLSVASIAIAAMIVVAWVAVSLVHTGGLQFVIRNQALVRYGGVTAERLVEGEWWRLVVSQFLHVYLLHALLNAAAILVIGWQFERVVSAWRFLVTYFLCGIAGQIIAVAMAPMVVATGASQAALGISAAAIVIAMQQQKRSLLAAAVAYTAIQIILDLAFAHRLKPPHLASFGLGLLLALCWLSWARAAER
jgi:rhomboid protease GluP